MMQPEILQSPWSCFEGMSSSFDQAFEPYGFTMDDHVDDCGLNAMFNTPEDTSSEVSSIPFPSSTMLTIDHMDHIQFTIGEETLQLLPLMEDLPMELDDFGPILSAQVVGIHGLGYPQEESEGSFPSQNLSCEVLEYAWSPTPSMKSSSIHPSLTLPQEDMEIDNKVSLPHLLEALVEAMDQRHKALAAEILKSMSQKVSPLGESNERLLFHMSQGVANHGDYLKGEALKNFVAAFRAFYQGIPDGKVAHFVATSAILQAIPQDCDAIHIVDSYMGLGVQWIPMIEAMAHMNRTLKLTSINWGDESPESTSDPFNFEEIKRQLYEHARSCGLKLKVEEKEVEELVTELKKMNKRGGRREFLAFNCMVGLPHMGKVRSRRQAMDFLRLAKDLINSSGNKGIITFGDGDAFEKLKNSLNFKSFFDGHSVHYHALLESIESHFPTRFAEARTAIECLFVAPYISPFEWLIKWEDMERDCHLQAEIGLEGCRLSKNILKEVREMLRGSEDSYEARIEGQNGNELVLEWKGTELVRVSAWRN